MAAGTSNAPSEKMEVDPQVGKGGPGSISSDLKGLDLGATTEDDLSSRGTDVEMDSETERRILEGDDISSPGGTTTKKKTATPEQKAKKAYKNAQAYLKKMRLKKDEDLTEKEKIYIQKNNKIVAKYEASHPKMDTIKEEVAVTRRIGKKLQRAVAIDPSTPATEPQKLSSTKKASKRIRSLDEEEKVVKKPKPSISFESPQELQIAIIDRSDLDGKMSTERWLEVEKRILTAIAELEGDESDEEISFDGAGWQKGVKVIGCSNRRSMDLLKGVVEGCDEIWPGAKLEIVERSALPIRKIISTWIPPPVLEDEATLKVIERMNRSRNLCTRDWRVIHSAPSKNGNGKDIVISIDDGSLAEIKKTQGSVKFGLGNLKFRFPNEPKSQTEAASGGAD